MLETNLEATLRGVLDLAFFLLAFSVSSAVELLLLLAKNRRARPMTDPVELLSTGVSFWLWSCFLLSAVLLPLVRLFLVLSLLSCILCVLLGLTVAGFLAGVGFGLEAGDVFFF